MRYPPDPELHYEFQQNRSDDVPELIKLLRDLRAYEYPYGPNTHPTSYGRVLWRKVDKIIAEYENEQNT
jgi:hypothetical protein